MGRQRKELEEADRALEEADSTMLRMQIALIEAREKVGEYEELMNILFGENENAERQGRFTRYFIEDIMAATHSLSYDAIIGEGSYGRVYKGQFHVTPVAIRVLENNCFKDGFQFQREMDRLSSIKHPRLVMLMGACPAPVGGRGGFIVYEHMPRGSLKDRLICEDGTPPLPWFDRLRIAAEVCEGLLFLHTLQPDPIVHHHVKPSNILLDNDLGSKISDFGLLQLLSDPSRVHDSTTDSNVYSFGILVLQLLTEKLANETEVEFIDRVKDALARDDALKHLLDEGGKWPPELARQLATIALDCTVERSLPRAMKSLEKILVDFPKPQPPNSPPQPPEGFCCPISMEVMKNPHIAEDGYSYEFEEIKRWFDNNGTSPMTRVQFEPNQRALIPNRSLRNAIEHWRNQTGFSHPA